MKQLDQTAYEYTVESFKKDPITTYTAIAKKLTSHGYVTKTNRPICEKSLSAYMVANGYRRAKPMSVARVTKKTTTSNKQLAELIFNSTKLDNSTKVKLLYGMVTE